MCSHPSHVFLCWMINIALQPTIGYSTRPNAFRHWAYPRAQLRTRGSQSFYCLIVVSLCRLLDIATFGLWYRWANARKEGGHTFNRPGPRPSSRSSFQSHCRRHRKHFRYRFRPINPATPDRAQPNVQPRRRRPAVKSKKFAKKPETNNAATQVTPSPPPNARSAFSPCRRTFQSPAPEQTASIPMKTHREQTTKNQKTSDCCVDDRLAATADFIPRFYKVKRSDKNQKEKIVGMTICVASQNDHTTTTRESQCELRGDVALRATLQAPEKFRNSMPSEASYPNIWDSGASISITYRPEDFIDALEPQEKLKIRGIANKMKVKGKGSWTPKECSV